MDRYVKTLKIKVDKTELDKLDKDFEKSSLSKIVSGKTLKELKSQFSEMNKLNIQLKSLEEAMKEVKQLSGETAKQVLADIQKEYNELLKKKADIEAKSIEAQERQPEKKLSAFDRLKSELNNYFKDFLDNTKDKVKEFFKDIYDDAKDMMKEIASYNLQTTTKYNSEAWSTMLQYGLTGKEAYAFNKAKQSIGVSSEEEFINAMQAPGIADAFRDYFKKYSDSYEKDVKFASDMEEWFKSWNDFKKELSMDLLEFFADNKDEIMSVMRGLMSVTNGILSMLSSLLSIFGYNAQVSPTDIVKNYTTSNKSLKIDNTFNLNETSKQQASSFGNDIVTQIVAALK